METTRRIKERLSLNILALFYSLIGVAAEQAGQSPLFSLRFFVFYALMILGLLVYAVLWQQVLKKTPLTKAFFTKAGSIVWGMIWGSVIFGEAITLRMVMRATAVLVGEPLQ